MLCRFARLIYPQDVRATSPDSYMVVIYYPCETLRDSDGKEVSQIKAVGYGLPVSDKLRYEMQGHWSKNSKHGLQFEVDTYNEVIIPTKEGIIAYLSSGQIKGIGPKMAAHIYDTFGNMALEVLDKEPEKLLSISGISKNKLQKIRDSYLANRAARDVVAFLTPHGITANRAVKLYREYGDQTMDVVKNHPYRLCEMAGVGFATADRIAMSMGLNPIAPERVDEGLLYTLAEAEGRGHLCMEKHAFIKACLKLLDTPGLTTEMLANRAVRLITDGRLADYNGNVYRRGSAEAEDRLATMIHTQLSNKPRYACVNLDEAVSAEEARLGFRLAPEQCEAVKMALSKGLSIITGGPGTGKTAIQRVILEIYRKQHPDMAEEILEYDGRYWTLAGKRINYMRDKTRDERYFILTLFAIARELETEGRYIPMVHIDLAVGLPPEHYGVLQNRFAQYFKRDGAIKFVYKDNAYTIFIDSVMVFPQAYAAVVPQSSMVVHTPRVFIVDIGGYTTDVLLLRHGKPDLQFCRSLESGIITMNNDIIRKVNAQHDMLIEDEHINARPVRAGNDPAR